MKDFTKLKLAAIQQICESKNKSTEYTIQTMQDMSKVDLDTVVTYLSNNKEHEKLFNQVNEFCEIMINLGEVIN